MWWPHLHHGWPPLHYGEWLAFRIIDFIIWGAILLGIAYLIYTLIRRGKGIHPSPLEVLKQRYARGELSDEEFERMERRLQESGDRGGP